MQKRSKGATRKPPGDSSEAGLMQRRCACGGAAGLSGECQECQSKQLTTQRQSGSQTASLALPSMVDEVVHSVGEPLEGPTLSTMEARFGHDFSNVRVHVDERAEESARLLGASAYTLGNDIVFGTAMYDPSSKEGTERLAHELTHVVQQRLSAVQTSSSGTHESEARSIGASVASGQTARVTAAAPTGSVQQDKDDNPLDEKAKKIIAIAKDEKKTPEDRAIAIVEEIVKQYYAADKSLVDSVVFDNAKAGSGVLASQKLSKSSKPEESTGIINVGEVFLKGVNASHFARRVLQVGHEIEHVHQWREGLAGGHKANEREFLAFYHEALNPEKPGTGRMDPGTRIRLIDAALSNYDCLDATKKTEHAGKKKELMDRRASEITAGGKPDTKDPPGCKKTE